MGNKKSFVASFLPIIILTNVNSTYHAISFSQVQISIICLDPDYKKKKKSPLFYSPPPPKKKMQHLISEFTRKISVLPHLQRNVMFNISKQLRKVTACLYSFQGSDNF